MPGRKKGMGPDEKCLYEQVQAREIKNRKKRKQKSMKKTAVIGLILAMTMSLAACGGKGPSEAASTTREENTSSLSQGAEETAGENTAAGAAGANTDGAADAAAGANISGTVGSNETAAAGNMTAAAAGENMTGAPAGGNMTAASANTTAAGGNATAGSGPAAPLMLDPPSMKTAYQPETEDQKYAREITGIFLLTDLKDTLSDDTGKKAAQLQNEGHPMYMEFFGNGTMRETVFGDPMGGLWDKEYLTLGSDRIPYEFSGDHVTVTTDNMNLTFTRTTQEELDLLLSAGEETGTETGAEEALAGAAEGTAADETAAAKTTLEGSGKKQRKERIISAPRKTDEEEDAEDGTVITDEAVAADAAGTGADDMAAAADAAEDLYGAVAEETDGLEANSDAADLTGEEMDVSDAADLTGEGTDAADAAESEMEEYIIVDDLCGMAVTGYDFSDPRGFLIHVRCENYSIYNMAFNIQEAVVNNVMFEPGTPEGDAHWSLEVGPLSSRETDIVFSADKAMEYGITSYDYVMFDLWVRNMDNWMDNPIFTGEEELYPTGKVSGEGLQNVDRRSAAGEQKIAEENKFTFTILGSETRENGDYVLKACIENLSWQNLTFSWDDVYVNGGLFDPFWAVETLPKTICYADIVFPAEEMAEKGVSAISEVTFTMSVWDSKDWLSYAIYTETSSYRA